MKSKKPAIDHTDITKAIQKFQKQGGLIKRLPEHVVPKGILVGGKFGMFESIFEPHTAGSGGGAVSSNSANTEVAAVEKLQHEVAELPVHRMPRQKGAAAGGF